MTDIRLPRLMDSSLNEVCRPVPDKLSITRTLTPLATATMTLGADTDVTVGMFAELFDSSGSAGIFRVTEVERTVGEVGKQVVSLEHGLTTLSDRVIPGYAELGGTGMSTGACLQTLLDQYGDGRWCFGNCDFNEAFTYSFENENLLTAILSLTAPLKDAYWHFDQSVTPWRLSLKQLSDSVCECRMNRNLSSVKITVDRRALCTQLFPFGYGEGADRLNISSVNGGVNCLTADTVNTWGVAQTVYTESTITDAATLKAAAQTVLDALKHPLVTVEMDVDDLSLLTGEALDKLQIGQICRVPLPDQGIVMNERIISVTRPDVFGTPTKAQVTLANRCGDAVSTLTTLSRKSAVAELYSQGAANQYALSFADNADTEHPAQMVFYLDRDAVHVNSVQVKFSFEAFRAYSKAAKSGGGGTATSETATTSRANWTSTPYTTTQDAIMPYTNVTYTGDSERTLDRHRHNMSHKHTVAVTMDIPSLNIRMPNHTHEIEYGVYTGSQATAATILVDGTEVPASAVVNNEFDAVNYLSKGTDGKIRRGTWHTITFTPNGMTRIVAGVYVRTFIRSLSGANL